MLYRNSWRENLFGDDLERKNYSFSTWIQWANITFIALKNQTESSFKQKISLSNNGFK